MKLHAEQNDGELYLGNIDPDDMHRTSWLSSRIGKAVDGARYRPWFILASEVEERIKAEEVAQGPNWSEKVRTYRQMLADRSGS